MSRINFYPSGEFYNTLNINLLNLVFYILCGANKNSASASNYPCSRGVVHITHRDLMTLSSPYSIPTHLKMHYNIGLIVGGLITTPCVLLRSVVDIIRTDLIAFEGLTILAQPSTNTAAFSKFTPSKLTSRYPLGNTLWAIWV